MTHFRQKGITGITLLALLLQLTLPFFAIYAPPQQDAPAEETLTSSLFSDKILICTQEGFRWLTAEELRETPPSPHREIQCALCFLHAKQNSPVPTSGTASLDVSLRNMSLLAAPQFAEPHHLLNGHTALRYSSRAPPSHA